MTNPTYTDEQLQAAYLIVSMGRPQCPVDDRDRVARAVLADPYYLDQVYATAIQNAAERVRAAFATCTEVQEYTWRHVDELYEGTHIFVGGIEMGEPGEDEDDFDQVSVFPADTIGRIVRIEEDVRNEFGSFLGGVWTGEWAIHFVLVDPPFTPGVMVVEGGSPIRCPKSLGKKVYPPLARV